MNEFKHKSIFLFLFFLHSAWFFDQKWLKLHAFKCMLISCGVSRRLLCGVIKNWHMQDTWAQAEGSGEKAIWDAFMIINKLSYKVLPNRPFLQRNRALNVRERERDVMEVHRRNSVIEISPCLSVLDCGISFLRTDYGTNSLTPMRDRRL